MKIRGLTQKRGYWYYNPPQIMGVRPNRVALKTKDSEEAVRMVWDLQRVELVVGVHRDAISRYIEPYLAEMIGLRKHEQKTSYRTRLILRRFAGWAHEPRWDGVTPDLVERWMIALSKTPGRKDRHRMSNASVMTYIQRLRGFLSWAVKKRYLPSHPMKGMRLGLAVPTRVNDWLSKEQRDRVIELCQGDDLMIIVLFGFFGGLRIGEIRAMTPEWIDLPGDSINVREVWQDGRLVFRPKNKKNRSVPLHPRIKSFLETYGLPKPFLLAPKTGVPTSISSVRYRPSRRFQNLCKAAGVTATYHTLRHTFASHLLLGGATLSEVASLLGDSLSVTEKHYAGLCHRRRDIILRVD